MRSNFDLTWDRIINYIVIASLFGALAGATAKSSYYEAESTRLQEDYDALDSAFTTMAEREFHIRIQGRTIELYDAITN